MSLPWYWPLVQDLRKHIEDNHMEQRGALEEVEFTEEYLHYESFRDGEDVTVICPWSNHCNCTWESKGHIRFKFIESDD